MNPSYNDFIAVLENDDLKGLILVDDVLDFPTDGLIPIANRKIAEDIIHRYGVYAALNNSGISRSFSVLLGGAKGTGKTYLIRYIAHMLDLPIVTFRYSGIISESAAETARAISTVFQEVRDFPCILCLDHIEALGGNIPVDAPNRFIGPVTKTLKQEVENLPNHVIFIATMNEPFKESRLGDEIASMFDLVSETELIASEEEAMNISKEFFSLIGLDFNELGEKAGKHGIPGTISWILKG